VLRAIIGFLVAPIVAVALATIIVFRHEIYGVWSIYLLAGGAIAYASALLFGLPTYLVMKRVTKLEWWQVGLAGGVCGLPYWLISEYPYTTAYFRNQGLTNLIVYVTAGVVAGLVFWLITHGAAPSNNSTIERDARKSGARPSL
jgi:hypothetical protein